MCSNPSVNKEFSRLLQVDLAFCEGTNRPAVDARQRSAPLPARRRRFFEPGELDALEQEYLAGATLTELGTKFGIHKHTVSTTLKRRGVELRYQSLGSEQIEQARELYASGLSVVQVGEQLSCDGSTIWRALRKVGMELRDCQGRERFI